jgi:single-stranded-DNA-specific exonuclease
MTADGDRARDLAMTLEMHNRERQKLTQEVSRAAEAMAVPDGKDPPPFLFAAHPNFSAGVVGLAAARLTEKFYRPSAVGQIGETTTRASARSIKEFHITEALDRLSHLLERHGGHAAAAGFTVSNANRQAVADGLLAEAAHAFGETPPEPTLHIDATVQLPELSEALVRLLDGIEPTGYGNPRPVLAARDVKVVSMRRVGSDGSHLKLRVSDGRTMLDAIAFRMAERLNGLPHRIDVAFAPEMNEWNGERQVQLLVRDARPAGQT